MSRRSDAGDPSPSPSAVPLEPVGTATLGVWILLASLSILFLASLGAYLATRAHVTGAQAGRWPPEGTPALPAGLWLSTLILLAGSATHHRALRAARADHQATLCRMMTATLVLGLVFLASQVYCWRQLVAAQMPMNANLYAFTFYLLTGLHAAHVIGGVVVLFIVTARSYAGRYSSAWHPGVLHSAMYWHFLDAAWILIFLVLLIFG